MELSDIPTPAVTRGPGWPILTATRIAVGAAFFRTMVWLMTGDGKDYDDFVEVPTPGLGVGRVRCAVCLPPKADQASKELQAPLVLVLQGGGFVLGQPEDGQQHDRKIADEVSRETHSFLIDSEADILMRNRKDSNADSQTF